ncbi:MAG: hypothetical protein Q4D56_13160 [Bacteroides sp.]|nr:hypothetical protein [Bacteroides sp.]
MKKIFLATKVAVLFALSALMALPGYSQESAGKPNVYIDYFSRPQEVKFSWAENLRSCVIEGINQTNRVELIDVDSQSALAIEQSRRESGELSDGGDMERLKVMTSEGANFLIQGRVTSIVTDVNKTDDGHIYYTATCAYTLKVINPADGKLVTTKNFKHGDGITNLVTADTKDEAVSKVCNQAIKAVRTLVDDAFKLQGVILEISATKKDKAEEVYISLGSDHGVGEGAYFSACIERQVAGRTSQKEIGQLKVKAVEGGDLTLCEVKKGGKEIKDAIDGGQTIIIKTMQKPKSLLDKAGGALNSL